jgi:signal transduction histidine kinase
MSDGYTLAIIAIAALLPIGIIVGVIAMLVSMSRREDKVMDQMERNRRAEHLAYAGALAGGLVHEIRNPLNSLNLNLQLLAEDMRNAETPEQRRALKRLQVLQSEAKRLNSILEEFLDFVRGHPLTLTQVEIDKLVDEVALFLGPELASKGIELRKSFDPVPPVYCDVNFIKQALLNLMLNAQQAMEEGRPREIILRTGPAAPDMVRVDVIDTGRGIAPENLPKIFEAFYSTRKGGTGLGLPTAQRIIEEHGGRLTVHSEVGKGSCFTLTLPLDPEKALAAKDAPAPEGAPGTNAPAKESAPDA